MSGPLGRVARVGSAALLAVTRSGPSRRAAKRLAGHRGRPRPVVPPSEPLRWQPAKELGEQWTTQPVAAAPAELPFLVERSSAGNQLPVYSDFKNGRTRVLTVVKQVSGDREALAAELTKLCGGAPVAIRPGRLEVKGLHTAAVKEYLAGLGF